MHRGCKDPGSLVKTLLSGLCSKPNPKTHPLYNLHCYIYIYIYIYVYPYRNCMCFILFPRVTQDKWASSFSSSRCRTFCQLAVWGIEPLILHFSNQPSCSGSPPASLWTHLFRQLKCNMCLYLHVSRTSTPRFFFCRVCEIIELFSLLAAPWMTSRTLIQWKEENKFFSSCCLCLDMFST